MENNCNWIRTNIRQTLESLRWFPNTDTRNVHLYKLTMSDCFWVTIRELLVGTHRKFETFGEH